MNSQKNNSTRHNIRKWLLEHPKLNPFLISEVGLKRYMNSSQRVLPNFIIIGAQKSGTTSLHHYISQHPSVLGTPLEEINYFSWCIMFFTIC